MRLREYVSAWRARPSRERWLIGAPAAVLAFAVLWFGVLEPLQGATRRLRAGLPALEQRLEAVRGEAADMRSAGAPPAAVASGIPAIAGLLERRGLPPGSVTVEAAGERRFRIAAARTPFHLVWPALQALQNDLGLVVIALQVDRLDAAQVRIEAQVGAGAR